MAKSLRSRWKRKCRAIKRERYAVKELARLKKMLGVKEQEKTDTDKEVMETDQVIFLDAGDLKKKKKKRTSQPTVDDNEDAEMSSEDEKVEVVEESGKKRIFNTKSLKDQNGQYPVWLHKRKIAKLKKAGMKNIKKKSKKRKR